MVNLLATISVIALTLAQVTSIATADSSHLSMQMDRAPLALGQSATVCADRTALLKTCDPIGAVSPGGLFTATDTAKILGRTPSPIATSSVDVVMGVAQGMICDGVVDDGPALKAADLVAKSLNADLYLPTGKTCRLKTGTLINTDHTHWRSLGGTTILIDGAATQSPKNAENQSASLMFADFSDLVLDGITFSGVGQNTPQCGTSTTACTNSAVMAWNSVKGARWTRGGAVNFGATGTPGTSSPGTYIQGLVAFNLSDFLFDNLAFTNNSGDGFACSNSCTRGEVRSSRFVGNGDSAFAGTIGCSNINFHDNNIDAPTNNGSPIVVMDRCQKWGVHDNTITGGSSTSQAIRAARYGDTTDVNQDFTIANNRMPSIGGTAISVEASAAVQGSKGSAPGGGRFAVTGNIVGAATSCVAISDSETGTVTGNVCKGFTNDGIDLIAYSSNSNTGSLTVSGNTLLGGQYGIRQIAAGGTLTPSTFGLNVTSGQSTAKTVYVSSMALTGAADAPDAPCRSYTPAITTTGGSGFAASNVLACFRRMYGQIYVNLTFTMNGSGNGAIAVTMPSTAVQNTTMAGQEVAQTGWGVTGRLDAGSSTMTLVFSRDASFPGLGNGQIRLSGSYRE